MTGLTKLVSAGFGGRVGAVVDGWDGFTGCRWERSGFEDCSVAFGSFVCIIFLSKGWLPKLI